MDYIDKFVSNGGDLTNEIVKSTFQKMVNAALLFEATDASVQYVENEEEGEPYIKFILIKKYDDVDLTFDMYFDSDNVIYSLSKWSNHEILMCNKMPYDDFYQALKKVKEQNETIGEDKAYNS